MATKFYPMPYGGDIVRHTPAVKHEILGRIERRHNHANRFDYIPYSGRHSKQELLFISAEISKLSFDGDEENW